MESDEGSILMGKDTQSQLEFADRVFKNFNALDNSCEEIYLYFDGNLSDIMKSTFFKELMKKTRMSAVEVYEEDHKDKDDKLGFNRFMSYWDMYKSTEATLKAICVDPAQQDILIYRFRALRKHVERAVERRRENIEKCLVRTDFN
jgi:hypothetical protein